MLITRANAQSLINDGKFDLSGYRPSFNYEDLDDGVEKQIEGPYDLDGYIKRAVEYIDDDKLELAKADLNYVINHNSEYGGSFFYRGICYKGLLKVDSAIADFNKAISLKTFQFYGPSHVELGYLYLNFYENYEKAKMHFELALKLKPDNPQISYALGYMNFKALNFNEAVNYANNCIDLDPMNADPYYLLAEIRLKQGQIVKAKATINELLDKYPDAERPLIFKSLIHFYQRQSKKGIKILEELLNDHPENFRALFVLGLLKFDAGDITSGFKNLAKAFEFQEFKSIKEFGISKEVDLQINTVQAVKFVAREIDSYNNEMKQLAMLYLFNIDNFNFYNNSSEYEALWIGKKYFPTGLYMLHSVIAEKNRDNRYWSIDNLKIVERDASHYHVYRSLGLYYNHVARHKDAEEAYTHMINLDRDVADGYKLRGLNRAKYNQFIKSVQDLNIYLNFNNLNIEVLEERANCYLKLGYADLAAKDYETVIEISDQVKGVSVANLASIKLHLGDTTNAILVFDNAIALLESKNVSSDYKLPLYEAYNYRGNIKLESKNFKEALEDFNSSIAEDEFFDLPYFNRGIANYRLGNFEQAKQDFSRWLEMHIGDPDGLLWRGKTEIALNEIQEAKSDLQRAQNLGITEAGELLAEISK